MEIFRILTFTVYKSGLKANGMQSSIQIKMKFLLNILFSLLCLSSLIQAKNTKNLSAVKIQLTKNWPKQSFLNESSSAHSRFSDYLQEN